MKKWSFMLIMTLFFVLPAGHTHAQTGTPPKVAVLFSKTSEDYANVVRAGGTYKGEKVDAKEDWSSILDKELKLYHLYEQQGFTVEKIYESDLNNVQKLHQYDAIVFGYTVMMNHMQRENVKSYIRDGGGAIFAYGTARNESATYPKPGQLDLTPLIYDTKTWIWEWDNLSEVYQSAFLNDIVLKNFTITTTTTQHPILAAAYKELGKTKLEMKNIRASGDWIEAIAPWDDAVKPLLVYSDYSSTSDTQRMAKNKTGAVYAFEHGKGRMVFTGFKIFDHLKIYAHANWEDRTKGSAFDGTTGDQDAKVLLKHSLNWVMNATTTDRKSVV